MRAIRSLALVLLVAGQSFAQPQTVSHGPTSLVTVAPPVTLKWELATAADVRVGFTASPQPMGFTQQIFSFNQTTAAGLGVDFNAWQAASVNPLFTRSIITFGDQVKESPVLRSFTIGQQFRLDNVSIVLHDYGWPSGPPFFTYSPYVLANAVGVLVPEPGTIGLVVIGLLSFVHAMSRVRSNARR